MALPDPVREILDPPLLFIYVDLYCTKRFCVDRKLYNTCVVSAQRYKRPLLTKARNILAAIGIYHQGVVVTLSNGQRWLVHKASYLLTISLLYLTLLAIIGKQV